MHLPQACEGVAEAPAAEEGKPLVPESPSMALVNLPLSWGLVFCDLRARECEQSRLGVLDKVLTLVNSNFIDLRFL